MQNDFGIFTGLASLPIYNVKSFYQKEIFRFFEKYKANLALQGGNLDPEMYVPRVFYLQGGMDLLILSMAEDYDISIRKFKNLDRCFYDENEYKIDKHYHQSFAHQVVLSSALDNYSDTPQFDNVKKYFSHEYASNFPLVSFTQIKLSNTLIINGGVQFLNCVVDLLSKKLNNVMKKVGENNFGYIIVESFGWHELDLIIFSKSYHKIFEIMPIIREICYRELNEDCKNIIKLEEYLNKALSKKGTQTITRKLVNNHPLIKHSITNLGFDISFLDHETDLDKNNLFNKISEKDKINFSSRFVVRGGHFADAVACLDNSSSGNLKIDPIHLCLGRGDLSYGYSPQRKSKAVGTKDFIKSLSNIINNLISSPNIISIYTIPTKEYPRHKLEADEVLFDVGNNKERIEYQNILADYRTKLKELVFDIKTIEQIRQKLKRINFPKVLIESIINVFSEYNYAVQDPYLYSNYIEVYKFLESIKENILEPGFTEKNINDGKEYIERYIEIFSHANNNRLFSSYLTNEIKDHNLHFKGGIQKLITAYSGFNNAIKEIFDEIPSLVFVKITSSIETSSLGLGLNFYHIFHPATLMTTCINEAAINSLRKLYYKNKYSRDYSYIFNFSAVNEDAFENIKNNIRHLNPRKMPPKYFPLYKLLEPKLFDHIFADFTSFWLTYGGDVELFLYWYWGIFESNPNKDNLSRMEVLLRILTVLKFYDQQRYANYTFKFSKTTDDFIENNIEIAREYLDHIYNHFEFSKYFEEVKAHVQGLIEKTFNKSDIEMCIELNSKYEAVKKEYNNGRTVTFPQPGAIDPGFGHCQIVLYSYLKLLKEKYYTNVGNNVVLRNEKTGEPEIDKKNDSSLLFDPLGGTYLWRPQDRRFLFMLTNTLIRSLWDFSVKQKKKILYEI